MKFFSTLAFATLAVTVMAAPAASPDAAPDALPAALEARAGNNCGNKQSVNCCNKSKNNQKVGGLFGVLFSIVLAPGQCSPIPIGAAIQQFCGNNVAQCCDNQQTGIININLGQCVAVPF